MAQKTPASEELTSLSDAIEQSTDNSKPLSLALRVVSRLVPVVTELQRDGLVSTKSARGVLMKRPASNRKCHVRVLCGVPVRCRSREAAAAALSSNNLFLTASTSSNLRSLALALSPWTWMNGGNPVVIEGCAGCGKSSAVTYLAGACGFSDDIVVLHLDDTLDSKSLLGNYICAEQPGEFRWQPGVITDAVLRGRWVVIEDIDRASGDVISALISLMQTRTLFLPGSLDPVDAHPDFLLLATRTLPGQAQLRPALGAVPISGPLSSVLHLWSRVHFRPLDSLAAGSFGSECSMAVVAEAHAELRSIVRNMHPHVRPVCIDSLLQARSFLAAFKFPILMNFFCLVFSVS
jgi:hypothetical protein